jgi:protein phosphatase
MNHATQAFGWPGGWACGLSDTGVVRLANEDNFLIDQETGLLIVADGMGGHANGARASAEAIDAVQQYLRSASEESVTGAAGRLGDADPDATWPNATMPAVATLFHAIEAANQRVFGANIAQGFEEGTGMGTTLVGIWHSAASNVLLGFHVGDSRLYRLRAGSLAQLTRDHSLYQQAIDAGVTANLPRRNVLIRAIGPFAEVTPDVRKLSAEPGDLFMLCSDGVHGVVPDASIAAVLQQAVNGELAPACAALLQLAIDHGSNDNATVIISRYP